MSRGEARKHNFALKKETRGRSVNCGAFIAFVGSASVTIDFVPNDEHESARADVTEGFLAEYANFPVLFEPSLLFPVIFTRLQRILSLTWSRNVCG